MPNIFLFTGENTYEMHLEVTRWVEEFRRKHGEENLSRIEGKNVALNDIANEVAAAPFIADNRLIILSGIPKLEKGDIGKISKLMHPSTLLLFVEPRPDKRFAATKELLAAATVKTFVALKGNALHAWTKKFAQSLGSPLDQGALLALIDAVGEDQMFLSSELRKLAAFADEKPIVKEDIEALSVLSQQKASWKLTDLITAKKTNEALLFAAELQKKGESPFALWGLITWLVSQMTWVYATREEGGAAPGVSPQMARSLKPFVRSIKREQMHSLIDDIADTDISLKTGGYRSTVQSPEELAALVDHFVTRLTAL